MVPSTNSLKHAAACRSMPQRAKIFLGTVGAWLQGFALIFPRFLSSVAFFAGPVCHFGPHQNVHNGMDDV